jgi:hypothetical protein
MPLITEKRSRHFKTDLMPPENPPKIFHTPDNIEWQFLQTFLNCTNFNLKTNANPDMALRNHAEFVSTASANAHIVANSCCRQ